MMPAVSAAPPTRMATITMIDLLSDFLSSPVMAASLLPALLIAVVTASMSVMVMAHRLSFLTVGVSHASLAGLGIAVSLSLPLLPIATVFSVAIALLLALMPKRQGISEDAGTGILFAGAMALGIVLISTATTTRVDLFGLLFGNILTVSANERHWLYFLGSLILIVMLLASRAWWSIAFDAVTAEASGLPVGALRLLLYGLVGLTVILCVKLAGIVLTAGLMVLPAACAWLWGRSLSGLWLLSVGFSVAGTCAGLIWSYAYEWPSGASVVLALCGLFVGSWTIKGITTATRTQK
ncbi:zinc transport system permease protein/manganese/iron transport system permease protein [Mariprofundus aestuarium]|uniref:Zinc transport system permease protein/manganese/iron transport system permease protein n=1 Tax=Mariprofundus aestuarium TaxID=1921086 RepID=A0A2K8L6H5_MARES|nr:metal ABC transporter permease [Mariprofundus aestuarium]ATX80564.1 zinc transport system permease protein/manganese/iron transport system permease protein [Mariprofundus aestuarium]